MARRRFALMLPVGLLLAAPDAVVAQGYTLHAFKKVQLSKDFYSEGATFGDLNGDQKTDVISGPFWYEGPDFERRHEIYAPKIFDTKVYSNNFFAFVHDFDADGWNDILFIGFPGQDASWFRNPRGEERHWKRHLVFNGVDNESPTFEDLDGDGRPELICQHADRMGWAAPDWNDPTKPWTFHPISKEGIGGRFTHGLGIGDINGDGRKDVLWRHGWWQQPRSLAGDPQWKAHLFNFAGRGGAQMYAYDIDGDGDSDVVSSHNAHGYGLYWFEQVKVDGKRSFVRHRIMGEDPGQSRYGVAFGNLHALDLVDMDGDGLDDIVTGNRYWAHGGRDKADRQPAPVYWFQLVRSGRGELAHFVPHEIADHAGVGTQVVAGDVTGDGVPDVVVGNKMGTFVMIHERKQVSRNAWYEARKKALGGTDAKNDPEEQTEGYAPRDAAARMSVPDGFRVSVVTGEPDLQQPIAFTLDERGRLWVAEAFAYPVRKPDGEGADKIVVFEDSTGDGSFDKRTVFADDLNLVSGLEVGFGGVWVGAAPYLLFIPDRDGDLVPDGEPEVLLDGWGYQDTHETLNAFIWGPDGWLYGCHGVFTHSKVGKPGTPEDERVRINAGVWRYHPTGHEFEVFAWGSSNPWGVDFDARGQAFITACVIPHLYHVIQGARYHRQSGRHFNKYVFDDIRTIADHLHYIGSRAHAGNHVSSTVGGGHAHCGAMIYQGDAFPEQYRGALFMSNIHGNRINSDLLHRKGSGFVGSHGDDFLLANDQWFRGINLKYGPDGNVYLIDWYDKQACHRKQPEIWDRTNGRIYKVSYGDTEPTRTDLAALTDAELIELHGHENEWFVRTSRRILQDRGSHPGIHAVLASRLRAATEAVDKLRTLWTLHATRGLAEEIQLELLGDAEEYVRGWAIQLALEDKQVSPATLEKMVAMAREDTSPVVRLYLASALQRLPHHDCWDIAEALLAHGEDADDHNLPLMIWYGVEPLVPLDPERALRMADATPLYKIARFIYRRAASGPNPGLAAIVQSLTAADEPRQLLILDEVLRPLTNRDGISAPEGWKALCDNLLQSPNVALRDQALSLAVVLGDQSAYPHIREVLATATERPRRVWALETLLRVKDEGMVPTLQRLLDDPGLRGKAVRSLASFDDARTPELILDRYATLDEVQREIAVDTLTCRAPYAMAMLNAVLAAQIPTSILDSAVVRRKIAQLGNDEVNSLVEAAWGKSVAINADKEAEIERYKKMLPRSVRNKANLSRGRALYAKTCMQCHKMFGEGTDIGPDITGSNRRDLDYLLFNLLDPSAEVSKDYTLTMVQKKDGAIVAGVIMDRDDQTITVRNAAITSVIALRDIAVDEKGEPRIDGTSMSLMPEGQLLALDQEQVRDLIGYLQSTVQVPMAAAQDNLFRFFNGEDLTGWDANPDVWSVENGEIVGRTATGLKNNDFARSHMTFDDFRLILQVKLTDDRGNSGVQLRSQATEHGMTGYQADIGPGWWGKLYDEEGRGLLWEESGEAHVHKGAWNTYEILATGHRIRTAINGQPCVDLEDPEGALSGILGLQVHSGGPTEVRFKDFRLELNPEPELKTR